MFAFQAGDPPSPRSRELPPGLADRVRPTTPVAGRTLPVPPPLAPLFPGGSLRRGTTTTVAGQPGHGATTLALALLAAASAAGSWCAAVGLPDPGVVAAAGLGLDLRRVVFVPHPGSGWAEAAGDLLSGVDAVLVRPPGRARLTAARHLTARARERQAALVVLLEGVGLLARGRRPGALGGGGRVGGHRPGPRPPARPARRGARQRPPRRRAGRRVLAVAARRLGRGRGGRGPGPERGAGEDGAGDVEVQQGQRPSAVGPGDGPEAA